MAISNMTVGARGRKILLLIFRRLRVLHEEDLMTQKSASCPVALAGASSRRS
jgi:hypothetical protein